jgi:hypothetical protein
MMQKTKSLVAIFLILTVVFLFFRLVDIDRTLSQDEILPKTAFLNLESPGKYLGDFGQPPLWQLPNAILASMLGTANWVFRIVPVAASILVAILILSYLMKKFGIEYATLGLLLLAFFPWQINTSNQVLQTSLLTLFMISSLLLAERFQETRNRSYIQATAVFSALALITMFIGVIAPIAISAYLLFSTGTSRECRFRDLLYFNGFTALLFAAAMAAVYLIYPLALTSSVSHAQELGGFFKIPVLGLPSLLILFLWSGPMALFFLAVLLTRTKSKDYIRDIHLLVLLSSLFIFLAFNSDQYRPFDRYFMVIIPSMIILMINYGRDIFARLIVERKLFLMGFTFAFGGFLLLGTADHPIVPLEPKPEFVRTFLASLGHVMVPYSSNGGPVGFYVPGFIILVGWAICAALFIISIFSRNKSFPLLLISIVLAFNLCISLYQAGMMDLPNPNEATSHLIENLSGAPLGEEIFVYRNQGMIGYLPPGSNASVFQMGAFTDAMKNASNFSVIVVDFPKISHSSAIWSEMNGCERVYHSNKFGVDEAIYTCRNRLS